VTTTDLIIRGGTAVTMDAGRRVVAADVRLRAGRIAEVGPSLAAAPGSRIVDARGCAVLPGLVHAHVHLCQVLFRNFAEDRALLPWLAERIWPLEAAHDATTLRTSALLGIAELLLSGATAALDMGTVRHHDAVFEAARDAGFRLTSGKAMMDAGAGVPPGLAESTAASLSESDRLARTWDGAAEGRLAYAYAPRFVPSCSPELLAEVAARVGRGGRLHTHASENADEVALVRRTTGLENVEYLGRLGLLSPRTTIAHGVHLVDRELALLAQSGTTIAHCPSANLKLASGIADTVALRRAGVNVGLGGDGAPCNNNLDQWREMKLAGLLPRLAHGPAAMPAMAVLEMATLGGARALGLEGELGSLEPGKKADVIVVDLQRPHVQPVGDDAASVLTALVYATQAADVRHVFVDGRQLVRDGRLTTIDQAALLSDVKRDSLAVRARAGLA
jgi:cytosine/adenosine deaminase-related metal-dependent hydrolase